MVLLRFSTKLYPHYRLLMHPTTHTCAGLAIILLSRKRSIFTSSIGTLSSGLEIHPLFKIPKILKLHFENLETSSPSHVWILTSYPRRFSFYTAFIMFQSLYVWNYFGFFRNFINNTGQRTYYSWYQRKPKYAILIELFSPNSIVASMFRYRVGFLSNWWWINQETNKYSN